jgi:hypothetical protein
LILIHPSSLAAIGKPGAVFISKITYLQKQFQIKSHSYEKTFCCKK